MLITFDVPFAFLGDSDSLKKKANGILKQTGTKVGQPKRTNETQVTFDLPKVFHPGSNPVENAKALQALLMCLCDLNLAFLTEYPHVPPLYDSGIYYDRTQVWDTIPALYARRYGDCKSLSAALIAEYWQNGFPADPVFRWMASSDGNINYHILVLSDHGWEDPSKVLGMTLHENAYFQKG